MKQQLTVKNDLFISNGIEIVFNLNGHFKFYPEDIKLERFLKREDLVNRKDVAEIGHLQSLLENPIKIPEEFALYINLAAGTILKRKNDLFIPALIHNAFLDIVALSNRDLEWKNILIRLNSSVSEQERVITL